LTQHLSDRKSEITEIELVGEKFMLLPERAVWWPAHQLVMVADIHFGKDAHLQRSGVAVPAVADQEDLGKIIELLQRTEAKKLVILGDVFHTRPSGKEIAIRRWASFCEQFPELDIVAVEGNHDRKGAAKQLPLHWVSNFQLGPIHFTHEPPTTKSPEQLTDRSTYTFCGHLHPCCRLKSGRREQLRLPVFLIRGNYCVLPAFGLLTGGMTIQPQQGDRIAVVTPEGVFPLNW